MKLAEWLFGQAGGGVKDALEGVGGLAKDLRHAITGKDPEAEKKAAEIQEKIIELTAQVNVAEAKHKSVFVAGWRPAIGWVGAISLGFYYIPQYVMATVLWVQQCWHAEALIPYPVTADGLLELVGGLLGIGLLRTIEKRNGTQANH